MGYLANWNVHVDGRVYGRGELVPIEDPVQAAALLAVKAIGLAPAGVQPELPASEVTGAIAELSTSAPTVEAPATPALREPPPTETVPPAAVAAEAQPAATEKAKAPAKGRK